MAALLDLEQTPTLAHAARRQPGPNRAAWAAAVGMQDKMNERDSLRKESTHLDERDPPVLKEPAARPPSDHGCAAGPEQTPAPAHAARRQPGLNRELRSVFQPAPGRGCWQTNRKTPEKRPNGAGSLR